jgi:hypothetical protein
MEQQLTEVFTIGLQSNAQYVQAQELAVLSDKYKEIVKQNGGKNNGGVNQLKILEQLLVSVSMVLIHDDKLREAMTLDKYISLVYSVRQELSTLFSELESVYLCDKAT